MNNGESRKSTAYTETETETETETYTDTKSETETKEASPNGSRSATPPSRSSLPLPSSPEEVEAHLKNEVGRGCLLLPPREIPECAQQYWADRDGLGWVDRSGVPISNWKSNAWSYAQRWARNLETKGPPPGEERDPFDPRFRKNI